MIYIYIQYHKSIWETLHDESSIVSVVSLSENVVFECSRYVNPTEKEKLFIEKWLWSHQGLLCTGSRLVGSTGQRRKYVVAAWRFSRCCECFLHVFCFFGCTCFCFFLSPLFSQSLHPLWSTHEFVHFKKWKTEDSGLFLSLAGRKFFSAAWHPAITWVTPEPKNSPNWKGKHHFPNLHYCVPC